MKLSRIKQVVLFFTLFFLTSCSELLTESDKTETVQQSTLSESLAQLDVYKDPNCGCCVDWIEHVEEQGFSAKAYNTDELAQLKMDKGIPPAYQSCHTAISEQGFIFEGHVPAKYIEQFLKQKPKGAFGLTVPSMPVGSPGMEVGDKFMPYKVFQLNHAGEPSVYAEVNTYAEQF